MAELFQCGVFQRQADFFCNDLTTCQDSDIFQHGFTTVAEARSLDSTGFQDTADVVDNQCRQCFTFNIFGNDQKRAACLGNLFQYRQQVTDVGNFLFTQQNVWIVESNNLFVGIVDEVRGQVTAIKLHTFHDVQFII